MEISPILGIRALSIVRQPKNGPKFSAVLEIENAFGPQRDSFPYGDRTMAGGQDETSEQNESASSGEEDSSAGEGGSTVDLIA